MSDLGVFVLSEYIKKSDFLPQEVGILRARKVPVIYVALHEEWRVPPGYDAPIQSFPMFDYKNPMGALPDLGALLRSHLSLPAESEAKREKRRFEDQHMRGNESVLLSERDAYVLVHAIKCGEKKILILGENALHPIHGGFEHLRRILEGGGTVRVLLLDFNSPMYSLREDIEDARRSARIRADWLASMGNLLELERMRASSGTLAVRCHSSKPEGSLVVVDRWLAQFNPYESAGIGGRRGFGHETGLWLNRGAAAARFADYVEMFETLWSTEATRELDLATTSVQGVIPAKISLPYKKPEG